jgi:phosphoglycolate phosphatase-like HAD superfamily hydrolase
MLINFKHASKYTVLIFDLDGTLLHLHINWLGYAEGMLGLVNSIDKSIKIPMPTIYPRSMELYNQAIIKLGIPFKKTLDDYCSKWESSHLINFTLNQPVVNILTTHLAYQRCYIWTSQNKSTTRKVTKDAKLDDYLEAIVAKEDVCLLKPNLDGFNLIHQKEKLNKEQYVLIGDSFSDQLAAKAAGIDFIQV